MEQEIESSPKEASILADLKAMYHYLEKEEEKYRLKKQAVFKRIYTLAYRIRKEKKVKNEYGK